MSKGSSPRQQRNNKAYAENWDRIFGTKVDSVTSVSSVGKKSVKPPRLPETLQQAILDGWELKPANRSMTVYKMVDGDLFATGVHVDYTLKPKEGDV